MKRLELVEMEGVSGGIGSLSPCMNAMFDFGSAIGGITAAANAESPLAFGIAGYKAMRAAEKMNSTCNAQ